MSLRDKLKAKSDAALAQPREARETPAPNAGRPITSPGAVALMRPLIDELTARAKGAEEREADLKAQLANAGPREVALDQLIEVPGRRRRLAVEEFEELKANLEHNPLIHPIAVRARGENQFEIVSGHNRVDAYRALGRQTIAISVVQVAEPEIDRAAFFANLLQPTLPPYEKFLGFRAEQVRTGSSQKDLAQAAGVAPDVVSRLLACADLSAEVHAILEKNPGLLGRLAIDEMVASTRAGRGQRVIEAVQLLAAGTLNQTQAVAYARKEGSAPAPVTKRRPVVVKGRDGREFCRIESTANALRVTFKAAGPAVAEDEIRQLLQRLAEGS